MPVGVDSGQLGHQPRFATGFRRLFPRGPFSGSRRATDADVCANASPENGYSPARNCLTRPGGGPTAHYPPTGWSRRSPPARVFCWCPRSSASPSRQPMRRTASSCSAGRCSFRSACCFPTGRAHHRASSPASIYFPSAKPRLAGPPGLPLLSRHASPGARRRRPRRRGREPVARAGCEVPARREREPRRRRHRSFASPAGARRHCVWDFNPIRGVTVLLGWQISQPRRRSGRIGRGRQR